MGLDGVEIVMEVEDEFGIIIPDPDVERILTVGELADYLEHRLYGCQSSAGAEVCGTSRAFYAVRRAMITVLGVDRAAIRPTTGLAEVVPYSDRPQFWQYMRRRGISAPRLRVPNRVQLAVVLGMGVIGFALLEANSRLGWNATLMLLVSIPILACAAIVIMRYSNAFLPATCKTVGDLARQSWLVDREPARNSAIFDRVATIISEQMEIPKESLRPDTRFKDILWD